MFLRDKHAWMWGLFIPLFIMTIFGLMDFNQLGSIRIGVVDLAQNELSEQIAGALEEASVLKVQQGDEPILREKIEKGDIDLLLYLPQDLSVAEPMQTGQPTELKLLFNQGQFEQTGTGILIVNQILTQFSLQAAQGSTLFALNQEPVDSRNFSYMDFMIPGIVGMMIMQLGIIGVAMIVVKYREQDILKRLRVTPMNPLLFLVSQVFTRLFLLMAQAGLIILLGKLFFDLHLYGNLFYIFVTALLGSLVFLSLGFAISGVAKSINTAMSMAQLIQMPMMFLSGIFFSREAFPSWLQKITDYLPLTYLAEALRKTMIEHATLYDVRTQLIALTLWVVGGLFLAVKLFRWE